MLVQGTLISTDQGCADLVHAQLHAQLSHHSISSDGSDSRIMWHHQEHLVCASFHRPTGLTSTNQICLTTVKQTVAATAATAVCGCHTPPACANKHVAADNSCHIYMSAPCRQTQPPTGCSIISCNKPCSTQPPPWQQFISQLALQPTKHGLTVVASNHSAVTCHAVSQ
jgi:hypothetical protein